MSRLRKLPHELAGSEGSKASDLSGFSAAGLHGAASHQTGSKCVGRGSSHHSAAQTPSTSDSKVQKITKDELKKIATY